MFCTHGFVCRMDSGGPLVCRIGELNKLIGVATRSTNAECNQSPAVTLSHYTSVAHNKVWILETVRKIQKTDDDTSESDQHDVLF